MQIEFARVVHVEKPEFYYYSYKENKRAKYIVYDSRGTGPHWAVKIYCGEPLTPEEQEMYITLAIARFGGTKKQNP